MSVRRLAPKELQPASFSFTPENLAWAKKEIEKYPPGRQPSAAIAILWRAQEQHDGWVSEAAIRTVAELLDMPYIRMLEIATFYTMFQLAPVGRKAHIQVCGTTPCMLRGAGDLIEVCKHRIHHDPLHVSADGDFSWEEVECLGACVNAPMVMIWKDTYEDLTSESFGKVIDGFASGNPPKPGPQIDRQFSAPVTGPRVLNDVDRGAPSGRSAGSGTVASADEPAAKQAAGAQAAAAPSDQAAPAKKRPAQKSPESGGKKGKT